ncbi:sigma-54 dependent transcriptional regulator [Vibrio penaeicida]|nr:sigma-54 dependent transcriptional regulator [Vibrio penaeicida]MDP2572337.1 sigma-54 dependent transcriptional regulator [Vibrio penaeicida]
MTMKHSILLIDDEHDVVDAVGEMLELEGFDVSTFTEPEKALKQLKPESNLAVLCDVKMPSIDGLCLLSAINNRAPGVPVILMSGHGDIPMAIKAMKNGAFDFLEKPLEPELLTEKLTMACQTRLMQLEKHPLPSSTSIEDVIIGDSSKMEKIRTQVLALAKSNVDTIINGETGTGKEVIARALHQFSKRKSKPFVAINCGGMSESIIESELFGHEAGAFTSANRKRIGKIEQANGGTLFLDEIETMPIAIQIKLLRFIQERVIERVGSNELIKVNITIIAASKADLSALSEQGQFRSDLFYRLNIASIHLPPLRDRKEDLQSLFRFFVLQSCEKYSTRAPSLYQEHIQQLHKHTWVGNVRELKNVAERFVLGIVGDGFDLEAPIEVDKTAKTLGFEEQIDQYEKNLLVTALSESSGNINQVSETLNLPRKTLYRKMKKHQLDKDSFKVLKRS